VRVWASALHRADTVQRRGNTGSVCTTNATSFTLGELARGKLTANGFQPSSQAGKQIVFPPVYVHVRHHANKALLAEFFLQHMRRNAENAVRSCRSASFASQLRVIVSMRTRFQKMWAGRTLLKMS